MESIKPLIDLFTALLSPLVAIIVTYIAYQQWKINNSKEKREVKSEKLQVYLSAKRFLSKIDETRTVDESLYREFQEATALADFMFDETIIDWLADVNSDASSWLDGEYTRISYNEKGLKKNLKQVSPIQDSIIDKLQNAHCQLLDIFKDKLI